MKDKKTLKYQCKIILFAGCITLPAIVQAQQGVIPGTASLYDVVAAINRLQNYVAQVVKVAFDRSNKLLFEGTPKIEATVAANTQLATSQKNDDESTDALNQHEVPQNLNNRDEREMLKLSALPTSDIPESKEAQQSQAIKKWNQSLSIESLLGPLAYPEFEGTVNNLHRNPAYNFVRLAGGLYQPITTLSLRRLDPPITDPKKLKDIQESLDYRKLQVAVRAYIAAQSVGANNLYQMMIARIPQKDLGQNAGMSIKNASPLQLQEYLATRRSQNRNWYQQMEVASPATVQRETLYVLAEIRQQLFQMQQQNERVLATLSIMEMQQNMQLTKMNISEAEQKLRPIIREAQNLPPEHELEQQQQQQ